MGLGWVATRTEVVLERLLARRERRLDGIALRFIRSRGELRLQLRLERLLALDHEGRAGVAPRGVLRGRERDARLRKVTHFDLQTGEGFPCEK